MPLSSYSTLAPTISVAGTALTAAQLGALVDMRLELELRVPSRCTLRFADPHYELASGSTFALGAEVKVKVRDGAPLFGGKVTSVAVDQRQETPPEFVVVVHDEAYQLARQRTVATYREMPYSDVVTMIASRNGLRAEVTGASGQFDYLLQTDSDLALLDAIADRLGCDWWVHDGTLHFKAPSSGSPIEVELGKDLTAFSVRTTGLNPDEFVVNGWDRAEKVAVTGKAKLADASIKPSSDFAAQGLHAGKKLGKEQVASITSLAAMTQEEARALSSAMRDRAAAAASTARGSLAGGDPRVAPGVTVSVKGSGPVSGSYHVSRVEHLYRAIGFETRFVAGDRRPTSLVDTLAPHSAGGGPLQHDGLVVGVVTNTKDPEGRGRVKVRFPGLSSDDESDWARVLTVGAGGGRGLVILPEVNDEVLVGFEAGDLRQPVVLGGLHGGKDKMTDWGIDDKGKITGRRLTSRLGHIIELGDGDDDTTQHILLQLANEETKLRLGKDKVDLVVPSGIPLSVKVGDSLLKFSDNGDITLTGPNITIKADANLKLEGSGKTEIKGAQVAVEGSGQTTVKGAHTQVEGSGMVEVKGGMVKIN